MVLSMIIQYLTTYSIFSSNVRIYGPLQLSIKPDSDSLTLPLVMSFSQSNAFSLGHCTCLRRRVLVPEERFCGDKVVHIVHQLFIRFVEAFVCLKTIDMPLLLSDKCIIASGVLFVGCDKAFPAIIQFFMAGCDIPYAHTA